MSISKPRLFLGGVLLVLFIGLLLASPFLLWVYHIEVGGQLLDAAVRWPEPRQSDSLPQLQNTNLEATESAKAANTSQAEKALNHLHTAIGWRPEHIHAYRLAASIYIAQEEWLQALQMLKQAQTWAPNHPLLLWEESLIYEAVWQMGEKAPQKIPETLDPEAKMLEAWTKAGFEASDFIERGNEARRRADYEEALRWYSRAKLMGRALDSGLAYTHYLAQLNDRDDESGAVGLLEEAISVDAGWINQDDRFRAWAHWGNYLFDKEDYGDSEAVLQKTVEELFPGGRELQKIRAHAYRTLALVQMKLDKQDAALQNLQKSIENNEEYLWAHVNYGHLLYQLDPTRIAETKGAFETALALESNNVGLWQDLILFWRRARELEQVQLLCQTGADTEEIRSAIADVCQTTESGELSGDWYFEYLALSKQGDQKAAEEALQRAIEVDEGWFSSQDRFRAWYQSGRQLFEKKQYQEAKEAFETSLQAVSEEVPTHLVSEAYHLLARSRINLGEQEAALESLQKSIETNAQNAWVFIRYGQLLYEVTPQQLEESTSLFAQALALDPLNIDLWKSITLFWQRKREIDQTRQVCQTAAAQGVEVELTTLCQGTDGSEISGGWYFEYQKLSGEGKQEEAYDALAKAVELDEAWFSDVDRFRAWYQWGKTIHQKREFAESERIFKETVARYPENVGQEALLSDVYRFMAESQNYQGRSDDALDTIQLSLQWNEKNVWAYIFFGQLLYVSQPQQIQKTEEAFVTALSLGEENIAIWKSLITFWERQGVEKQVTALCQNADAKGYANELQDVCP